jgi:superfamily II DNA or RNA helicase
MPLDIGYFGRYASALTLEESVEPGIGLRRGQAGALHALAAHFSVRADPAIVSLPTGYGKTAVLLGACFLLKATRVLLVVPTSTLRKQAFSEISQLNPLKKLCALPLETPLPQAHPVLSRLQNAAEWDELRETHISIATPHVSSPAIAEIATPPTDLFDLILFDEGHHTPARTWSALIEAFPAAKHVLVSATPFRIDRRELPGRIVFQYPLKRAVTEKAFSKVIFRRVEVTNSPDPNEKDRALAMEAERILRRDQANGLNHRMLIRAATRSAADTLAELYQRETTLLVRSVHSGMTRRRTERLEEDLRQGRLDGLVCVDMFGEGYDLPMLKIAVLHAPQKSLVPTLQFIGRFARTNALQTGEATFIAIADEVSEEGRRLYDEGVDWDELLSDIADGAQLLELQRREALQSFDDIGSASADYEQLNPGQITIYRHLEMLECAKPPDFSRACAAVRELPVARRWFNADQQALLLLTAHIRPPRWSDQDAIADARHDVFLLVYRPEHRRLYIASSNREARYYNSLIEAFVDGEARRLSYSETKRVLAGFQNVVHYNVGLRNISPGSAESYRTIAGSSADRVLQASDARSHRQGHFMGRGQRHGELESVGASSRSRTWSSGSLRLPEFLEYVRDIDRRLASGEPIARSGLDVVPAGSRLTRIPANTIAGSWPKEARRNALLIRWNTAGAFRRGDLIDSEIRIIGVAEDGNSMHFSVGDETSSEEFSYRLSSTPPIVSLNGQASAEVEIGQGEWLPLADWMSEHPPYFFSSDLDCFQGQDVLGRPVSSTPELREGDVISWPWTGCDTRCEFDLDDARRMTVHKYVEAQLVADASNEVILYDHRSGELADYVAIARSDDGKAIIRLFHCKAAGGPVGGHRVDDVLELATQCIKGLGTLEKDVIRDHMARRTLRTRAVRSRFVRGDMTQLEGLLGSVAPIDVAYEIYAVQPGIRLSSLVPVLRDPMAASIEYAGKPMQGLRLMWVTSA